MQKEDYGFSTGVRRLSFSNRFWAEYRLLTELSIARTIS